MDCPNCQSTGNFLLFSHEDIRVMHCGCYYEGRGTYQFPDGLEPTPDEQELATLGEGHTGD